jgi:hypothetical protein
MSVLPPPICAEGPKSRVVAERLVELEDRLAPLRLRLRRRRVLRRLPEGLRVQIIECAVNVDGIESSKCSVGAATDIGDVQALLKIRGL